MITNPFVSDDQFYDRTEIRKDLLRYIHNQQNVLLYGPRRYGKSSLAFEVAKELRQEGRVCIWFDLMKVNSLEHFVTEYAKAAYAVASRTERNLQKVLGFFRALRPKVSVGAEVFDHVKAQGGRTVQVSSRRSIGIATSWGPTRRYPLRRRCSWIAAFSRARAELIASPIRSSPPI